MSKAEKAQDAFYSYTTAVQKSSLLQKKCLKIRIYTSLVIYALRKIQIINNSVTFIYVIGLTLFEML